MPEAVRKPFCGPSGRKIDSNGTPHTHQRFAEAAPSILLLRANNHFERFYTAWPQSGSCQRERATARSDRLQRFRAMHQITARNGSFKQAAMKIASRPVGTGE